MDLLGGYGSDESEESAGSSPKRDIDEEPKLPVPKRAVSRGAVGKRIVSLHAVLPQAIRDGLTSRNNDESSSDEEEYVAQQKKIPSARKPASSKDSGLSNFLSELQSASTVNPDAKVEPMGLSLVTTVETSASCGGTPKVVKEKPAASGNANLPTVPSISVVAAPRIVSARRNDTSTLAAASLPKKFPSAYQVQPEQKQQKQQQECTHEAAPPHSNAHHNKKRSRQELEKALRSGQFNSLQDAVSLEAGDYSANVQQQQQQPQYQGMGFKKTSLEVSSKHRSKHQINQLMASAISLEQQRAQQAGIVKRTSSNSTRANAKRKYGW